MYHPSVSVPSEVVWEGVRDKGESTELVLDCYFFGYGCHWDSVGVPAKADEGTYGRVCVASVLAVMETKGRNIVNPNICCCMGKREEWPGHWQPRTLGTSSHMGYLILSYSGASYLILAPSQSPCRCEAHRDINVMSTVISWILIPTLSCRRQICAAVCGTICWWLCGSKSNKSRRRPSHQTLNPGALLVPIDRLIRQTRQTRQSSQLKLL